jgi:hypothetical protein
MSVSDIDDTHDCSHRTRVYVLRPCLSSISLSMASSHFDSTGPFYIRLILCISSLTIDQENVRYISYKAQVLASIGNV